LKNTIIELYAEGGQISIMAESLNIDQSTILNLLIEYKETNRFKKTFTDNFKKMIAKRDMSGIARRTIASELQLNANTIKKACEKFGQSNKERASSANAFTRVNGKFSKEICPSCESKRVNEVDENTIYCLVCGNEFIHRKGYILKINWEYLSED
jgi:transposase-like protein